MNTIEDIYNNLQEELEKDVYKKDELNNLWDDLKGLNELLKNTISEEDYAIFDDYLLKENQLIDLERKKAFTYGYKLSNNLMIDSLRD